MNTIKCPHCKKQVELSEAIIHEFQTKIREEEKKSLQAEFEKEKAKAAEEHEKKLRIEFELKNKDQAKELEEARKKEEEAKRREKELAEKLAHEKEERENAERKIKLEAKEEASKEAQEKHRLEKMEYEKKLGDMQKALEDAQRKGKQGSQQLQGEVLELDLEEKLRSMFPQDEILPVPKGMEGGDILQKVKYKDKVVGTILWELKRTKTWQKKWLADLKEEAGKINATEALLVSQTLPVDIANFDRKEGVWITTYEHAINICRYIRFLITTVASVKSSANHTEEEWALIRDYMMGDAFKRRMQAHFDGVNALRTIIDAEKRSTILRWKRQEAEIEKLDRNTTSFYGELKSIVANLPEINGVDTLLIGSEVGNSDETLF